MPSLVFACSIGLLKHRLPKLTGHLLRDRHELKEQHPDDANVQQWAQDVKAVYNRAITCSGPDPSLPPAKQEAARRKLQHAFERELWQLCALYTHTSSPLHTLCERVERFLPELFVFVAVPVAPAENNLAERSVRPLVIARKISGGSGVHVISSAMRCARGDPLLPCSGATGVTAHVRAGSYGEINVALFSKRMNQLARTVDRQSCQFREWIIQVANTLTFSVRNQRVPTAVPSPLQALAVR